MRQLVRLHSKGGRAYAYQASKPLNSTHNNRRGASHGRPDHLINTLCEYEGQVQSDQPAWGSRYRSNPEPWLIRCIERLEHIRAVIDEHRLGSRPTLLEEVVRHRQAQNRTLETSRALTSPENPTLAA
jgi:hypothetical protein